MGLLRELCASLIPCLILLSALWLAFVEGSELLEQSDARPSALPYAARTSQPTELEVIASREDFAHKPSDRWSGNFGLSPVIEAVAPEGLNLVPFRKVLGPRLLAATDATEALWEEPRPNINAQPTELSAIGPVEEVFLRHKGHQASDAALLAAVETGTPDEMAEAPLLDPPAPTLFANIDLTKQRMTVSTKAGVLHTWKISSARGGYVTPVGVYKAQWTSRMHYSRQYYNSPMPYSVFFHRGYAIHGTNAVGRLGRPASHGCVRLRTSNAKKFYNLVHKHGKGLTKIAVRGTPPASRRVRDSHPRRRYRARKRVRRASYQPFGLFSSYSYRQPRNRRYGRRRYSRY